MISIEKLWPLGGYIWSQEAALEILSRNDYDVQVTEELFKTNSVVFEQFLNGKHNINKKFSRQKITQRFKSK